MDVSRATVKRAGVVLAISIAAVPVFATAPTLTVNYASFGTAVLGQIETMLAAIIPVAAVMFGTLKGISWLRSIL